MVREEHLQGRCNNSLNINLGDEYSGLQSIIDEGKQFMYSKCANCNLRFYHMMKSADDLLRNIGGRYDTRSMKILRVFEILFKDCEKIKDKKYFGTMRVYKLAQPDIDAE